MTDPEQPVPLGDVDIAVRVAQGVRSGGRAEREPTVEQLLAAFGETEPTPAARHRARAALAVAGVSSMPDLGEAAPGARVRLLATAADGGGGPSPVKAVAGVVALVAVIGGIALAAGLSGDEDPGDQRLSDALPAGTTAASTPAATSVATVAPPLTVTTSVPTTTQAVPATTAPASPTTTAPGTTSPPATTVPPTTEADEPTAEERRAARRRARERRAREAAARRRALARRPITVRLNAPAATYLCADRGPGTAPLFAGTLEGARTFRGRRIRLNVGLSSTRVTKNGKTIVLSGSPAGLDLTRNATRVLAAGARPSC